MLVDRGLIFSFLAHAVLIIFMIIKVSFFTPPVLNLSQAIKVDMVGLPEKTNAMPEKITDSEPDTPPAKPKMPEKIKEHVEKAKLLPIEKKQPVKNVVDAVNIDKAKDKQKAALARLKKLAAIEKIKEELSEKSKPAGTAKPIKGRVITSGTKLAGLDRLQSEEYLVQLDGLIKAQWQLPQYLIGKNLKTKIQVKFSPAGQVLEKKVMQSSGNPTYDDFCLQAIERAAPFPKVPEKFTEVYSEDGIVIGFPE